MDKSPINSDRYLNFTNHSCHSHPTISMWWLVSPVVFWFLKSPMVGSFLGYCHFDRENMGKWWWTTGTDQNQNGQYWSHTFKWGLPSKMGRSPSHHPFRTMGFSVYGIPIHGNLQIFFHSWGFVWWIPKSSKCFVILMWKQNERKWNKWFLVTRVHQLEETLIVQYIYIYIYTYFNRYISR